MSGEPLSSECLMCGELVFNHPAVVECFEQFGELYCEFCATEALQDEPTGFLDPTTGQLA